MRHTVEYLVDLQSKALTQIELTQFTNVGVEYLLLNIVIFSYYHGLILVLNNIEKLESTFMLMPPHVPADAALNSSSAQSLKQQALLGSLDVQYSTFH